MMTNSIKISYAYFYADVKIIEMFKLEYECNFSVKIYVLEASESFYQVKFYEKISHAHL